jgi:hypothetical protein
MDRGWLAASLFSPFMDWSFLLLLGVPLAASLFSALIDWSFLLLLGVPLAVSRFSIYWSFLLSLGVPLAASLMLVQSNECFMRHSGIMAHVHTKASVSWTFASTPSGSGCVLGDHTVYEYSAVLTIAELLARHSLTSSACRSQLQPQKNVCSPLSSLSSPLSSSCSSLTSSSLPSSPSSWCSSLLSLSSLSSLSSSSLACFVPFSFHSMVSAGGWIYSIDNTVLLVDTKFSYVDKSRSSLSPASGACDKLRSLQAGGSHGIFGGSVFVALILNWLVVLAARAGDGNVTKITGAHSQ